MGALITNAAWKLATSMPPGKSSPLIQAEAGRQGVLDTSHPIAPSPDGTYLSFSCFEQFLSDLNYDFGAFSISFAEGGTQEEFNVLSSTTLIKPSDLPTLVPRLQGEKLLPVSKLKDVPEVTSAIADQADATTYMTSVLEKALVKNSVAASYMASSYSKVSVLYEKRRKAAGNSTDAPELDEFLDILQSDMQGVLEKCPATTIAGDITQPASMGDGGKYVELKNSTIESTASDAIYAPGWVGFTSSGRPDGHKISVEMVVSNGTVRSIAKAGGVNVTGLLLQMAPESLSINSVKVIGRMQTLSAWVEEHWGDDLDQVTFTGKTLAFIGNDPNGVKSLLVNGRGGTEAYKEIRALVDLFKTNGLVIQGADIGNTTQVSQSITDPNGGPITYTSPRKIRRFYNAVYPAEVRSITSHPRTGLVKERLYIRLTFDSCTCIGYFDAFEVSESADMPNLFSYNASFRSELTTYR